MNGTEDVLRGIFHQKATAMAAILLVLYSLHVRGRIDQAPLELRIDLIKIRKVVKQCGRLPKGTLTLPPCVPNAYRVCDKSWKLQESILPDAAKRRFVI